MTILHVDLTTKVVKTHYPSAEFVKRWMGGRGFNTRILFEFQQSIPKRWNDPENVICISAGLLAGTNFPSSGRTCISVLKSPVSGLFSDGNFGGHFAPALKLASIDTLVITGKLDTDGYIHISREGKLTFHELKPIAKIWGNTTTQGWIEHRHKGAKVMSIGTAGSHMCVTAVVNCDNRVAGGGGSGAVMGSKNLKAIAVDYDIDESIVIGECQDEFNKVCEDAEDHIRNHPVYDTFKTYGTTSLVEIHSGLKYYPTHNWMKPIDKNWKALSGQAYLAKDLKSHDCTLEELQVKHAELADEGKLGCKNCPIVCSNVNKIEYETINCLGSKIGVDNLEYIVMTNTVYMNDAGLDVIETTSIISTLMELSEHGYIDYDFAWGDEDSITQFLSELIMPLDDYADFYEDLPLGACFKEGFVKGMEKAVLCGHFSIHYGKMYNDGPWGGYDNADQYEALYNTFYVASKGKALSGVVANEKMRGVALALATSTRGADHLRSLPTLATYASWYMGKGGFKKLIKMLTIPLRSANIMKSDVKFLVGDLWDTYEHTFGVPKYYINLWRSQGFLLNPKKLKGWGGMIKFTQALYAVSDSLSTCRFTSPWRFGVGPKFWAKALFYMGYNGTMENKPDEMILLDYGHNINTLEKELLYHYGKPIYDSVPSKFFSGKGALKQHTWRVIYQDYINECGFKGNGRPRAKDVVGIVSGDYSDREMLSYFIDL